MPLTTASGPSTGRAVASATFGAGAYLLGVLATYLVFGLGRSDELAADLVEHASALNRHVLALPSELHRAAWEFQIAHVFVELVGEEAVSRGYPEYTYLAADSSVWVLVVPPVALTVTAYALWRCLEGSKLAVTLGSFAFGYAATMAVAAVVLSAPVMVLTGGEPPPVEFTVAPGLLASAIVGASYALVFGGIGTVFAGVS